MRILVVSNLYPPLHLGGYELRCREVVDRLRASGHCLRVLTSTYENSAERSDEPYVRRVLHSQAGPPYPPEDLAGLLDAEVADRLAVATALRDWRPDIVDVWGMEFVSQGLVGWLAACGVPVHFTIEDIWLRDAWRRDPLVSLAQVAHELRVATPPEVVSLLPRVGPVDVPPAAVTFVSRALAALYREAAPQFAAARVRMAGIDLRPFQVLGPPPPPPVRILSVGQLTPERGPMDLLDASERVVVRHREVRLEIKWIGGGSASYLGELRARAAQVRSPRLSCEFVGQRSSAEVAAALAGAHVFVHPSRLPEGLPRVLMEAMAAGVPVIATSGGGQRDILDDGRWGALVAPRQPAELAHAIEAVLRDPLAARLRAAEAREHARRTFDIETYAARHAEHLRTIARPGTCPARIAMPKPVSKLGNAVADFRAALVEFASSRAEDRLADEELFRIGVTLKRCGALPAAKSAFEALAGRADLTARRRAHFHLGEIGLVQGQWEAAQVALGACLRMAPEHRKAAYDLEFARRRQVPPHLRGLSSRLAAASCPP